MNDMTTVNPFGEITQASGIIPAAALAAATQAKAIAEVRYLVAFRRPRDMDQVRARILKDCHRPGFAAVARYVKPIGKDRSKWPTGPSIRFAESAVRAMGNVSIVATTTHDDSERRIVHIVVTDLESNVPYEGDVIIAKTIERRAFKEGDRVLSERLNSYGDTVYTLVGTDEDIISKQAALESKMIRTLSMRLIPGDIVDEAMEIVKRTLEAQDAEDPDAARRKLFDAFGTVGVTVEQLKQYLGSDGSVLAPKELAELRKLYTALRDEETTWREVTEGRDSADAANAGAQPQQPASDAAQVAKTAAATARKRREQQQQAKSLEAGTAPPSAETSGDASPDGSVAAPASATTHSSAYTPEQVAEFARYAKAVRDAASAEAAALELDAARTMGWPAAQLEELTKLYREQWGD